MGRERGASVAEIGVLIDNDAAQRAYEKNGFELVQEIRHPDFEATFGTPGMRELRRAI
jgi:RimJ/RimL family protein N-acetyltransferase